MNHLEINTIALAIERALEQNGGNWNPVYADVINAAGEKVGHIVKGYPTAGNFNWSFYPVAELRKATRRDGGYAAMLVQRKSGKRYHRVIRDKHLLEVIPKWVGDYTINNVRTYKEEKFA